MFAGERVSSARDPPQIKERVSKFKKGLGDAAKFAHFNSQGSTSLEKLTTIDPSILQQFNVFASDFFSITSLAAKKFAAEVFSARLSPNDAFFLGGLGDGTVSVQPVSQSKNAQLVTVAAGVPVTAVEWSSRSLFYAAADGTLHSFDIKSDSELPTSVGAIAFEDDQILTLDHSAAFQKLLVAGKNREIAVVDEAQQKVCAVYKSSSHAEAGHANRIFCVRFAGAESQVFASGGWDAIVYIWDLRAPAPVAHIFGPVLSGESLDAREELLVVGSYREQQNLELFDLRSYKKLADVPFKSPKGQNVNYISACRFNRGREGPNLLIAGSCIGDQVTIYRKNISYQGEVYMTGVGKGVFACGFGNLTNKFYVGTREGHACINALHQ